MKHLSKTWKVIFSDCPHAAAATNTYPYDNIAKIFTTIKSP